MNLQDEKKKIHSSLVRIIKRDKIGKPISGNKTPRDLFEEYKNKTVSYLHQYETDNKIGCFALSTKNKTIYGYTYYVMTSGLLGYRIGHDGIKEIEQTLVNCQQEDGICVDNLLFGQKYISGDGWGARHFLPHYIIALRRLNKDLLYRVAYLNEFQYPNTLVSFLSNLDWHNVWHSSNLIFNVLVMMQYEREAFCDNKYDASIEAAENWLLRNINEKYCLWTQNSLKSKSELYDAIRGMYHILPILIRDGKHIPHIENTIDLILSLQNKNGGFDFNPNSSACDDIDAIEPLIRLSLLNNRQYKRVEIEDSIHRCMRWMCQNQMPDGGSVFCLGSKFNGWDDSLSSGVNESNMFGTWFRTLAMCYMNDYLCTFDGRYEDVPGYEYPLFLHNER